MTIRRSWPTVTVLLAMVGLQFTVAAFSVYVLSAVRAYITGESLYSKGQKDAQIYLVDYAENQREEDYQKLIQALSVPIADRRAREALQQPEPDVEAAYEAFVAGGNHPADVPGLIRVFRWFGRTPLMAPAIATWAEGDQAIEQMRRLADTTRQHVLAGETDADALRSIRAEAPALNRRLTELERRFSAQLGEASRNTQTLLLLANGLLAASLAAFGAAFVRHAARRQALTEAEVVRRQQSLQDLLDSAAEGVIGLDADGRCSFVNHAALRLLGYADESELLGQPMQPTVFAGAGPATPATPLHDDRGQFRRRDGSSFPVERWSHPIVRDGRLEGAVTTFFDISERVRLRRALRREQIVMEQLIGTVSDAVITFGEDGCIRVFNAAAERLFLTPARSALGQPLASFLAEPTPPLLQRAREAPAGALHELTGRRADGSTFPLEASFSRVQTDDTVLDTFVLRDVTTRELALAERRARESLEATSRAKTEFLSRMSHELRTPLNAVIGFAQLMRLDTQRTLPQQQLDRVRHIERASAHLLALVNDVLDLSRIESGSLAVSAQAVELGVIAEEASTMVSPLVTRTGVELFVLPPAARAGAWVSADPVRLRQVLVNLLSNAVKYNRPGGRVTLSWRVEGERCQVSVADDGRGIAPETLERLFEPFNRPPLNEDNVEGTGIGLVLSRHLTQLMGGALHVTSELGKGTVATVALRSVEPAPPGAPVTATAVVHRPSNGGLDVLYAEDNEVNAEIVRQVFALRPSVTLRIAPNGQAALDMVRERAPDLMLVDMNLGDMTGLELARALRREPSRPEIELIALSADALPEQIDTAMRNGFQDYLTKPVDFQQLLQVIDARMHGG